MTVYKIGKNKIKITLTDREVLSYFGTYDEIPYMAGNTQIIISLLLEESLSEFGIDGNDKLLVEIKAKENCGCIIIVSPAENNEITTRESIQSLILEFSDFDSVTSGICRLYQTKYNRRISSSLYKMPETYRLILKKSSGKDYFYMNEYCIRQSNSLLDEAFTEEYGELLVKENAIEYIGDIFSTSS